MNKQQFLNLQKATHDPVWFAEEIIGISLEPYQKEVLKAIGTETKVAWRSGHGVGKTAVAAMSVLWFLFTRPHCKVITTATSWRQVIKQLWPEIHKWRQQADLSKIGVPHLEIRKLGIWLAEDWFASGEASDNPEKMEGFHADFLFFVIDEGKSVPDATYEAIEGSLTTPGAKQLVISTPPPMMSGYFYDIFSRKRIGFKTFHTSAVGSPRVSQEWLEARKQEWGEDSPVYQTRVLGEFAESADDSLIPLKWIEKAVELNLTPEGDKHLGVDVARYGADKSVFILRQGKKVLEITSTAKEDTMRTTGRVAALIKEHDPQVKVDVIGIGAGVVDRLEELGHTVTGVNVACKADDSENFANLRAELYGGLKERFRAGEISIPNDEELIGQLANLRYKFTSRGQTQIEGKDEMKKRGLKSPDLADALMLAFAKVDNTLAFAIA